MDLVNKVLATQLAMRGKQSLRDSFSLSLTDALVVRYRKVPSAAFVANQFNLRVRSSQLITQETARRWMRGLGIPEFDKLLVLRSWLSLDLNALGMPSIKSCLLYTSPSPRDRTRSRMPSSA